MSLFISMFVFALIGAISPGPVNIIATGAGASFGFRLALPHVIGASVGYCLVVFIVGVGLNEMVQLLPKLSDILQYFGAAFLLYMAFKIAVAPVNQQLTKALATPPNFLQGTLAQGLNPKAWMVAMSGVSLFVSPHPSTQYYLLVFCTISLLVCFIGVGVWAAIGTFISRYLRSPARMRRFNHLMALLLAGSVVSLFV
ncbi:LysE family translocator [Agarivorans sp. TSD2052]|uniref:LysE family translocator n=1 Tax=Agarivorans sp. TSD2052 TaxID=2937286 RepID=UPI00200F7D26|nr:LysE family translocator [Agarivorans sp. TSD2052]UPW19588.1 LysE family translocator [Agarivorans sp. TSD2052]